MTSIRAVIPIRGAHLSVVTLIPVISPHKSLVASSSLISTAKWLTRVQQFSNGCQPLNFQQRPRNSIVSNLHSILTEAWRLGTGPWRHVRMQKMRSESKVPTFILFYHRIADTNPNPWTMTFSQFEQQIRWFQKNFDIVSLEETQRRIENGSNTQPTLSITFDDGYAENSARALPLLLTENIPVTYFVTTQNIRQQKPFPHDVEDGAVLPVDSVESIRAMANAGIEIGAHTRTHPNMGSINDPHVIYDEIISATQDLEDMIGRKVNYFAFPFGQHANLNVDAFHLLRQHGFKGACSAYGGWNDIGGDSFHLQRIHGDPSFTRMRNWLTYDPRIGTAQRYDYSKTSQSVDWATWQQGNKFDAADQPEQQSNDLQAESTKS